MLVGLQYKKQCLQIPDMEVPKSGKMVFAKPVYHMLCYQSDKVVKSSVEKTENT